MTGAGQTGRGRWDARPNQFKPRVVYVDTRPNYRVVKDRSNDERKRVAMALKPDPDIATQMSDRAGVRPIPTLYKTELEEHRRLPQVQARLKRVQALIDSRAQQKV